jgi:hypothetical protein
MEVKLVKAHDSIGNSLGVEGLDDIGLAAASAPGIFHPITLDRLL